MGIFGPTDCYYGLVETQNRGTLHMHCLIWLKNADPQSIFTATNNTQAKTKLINYLEYLIHQGLPNEEINNATDPPTEDESSLGMYLR
jgi:hypothetical protein